jgi:flagellar FliL protein
MAEKGTVGTADTADDKADAQPVRAGWQKRYRPVAIAATVVLLAGGLAWYLYAGDIQGRDAAGEAQEASTKGGRKDGNAAGVDEGDTATRQAIYVPLDPPLVVNVNSGHARFLQASMEVLTREPAVADAVKVHLPAIRNNLMLLLSSQEHDTLDSTEGKERLRLEAMEEVRRVLKINGVKGRIDAVYFTGFVMQ